MAVIVKDAHSSDGDAYRAWCNTCTWYGVRRFDRESAKRDALEHLKACNGYWSRQEQLARKEG